MAVFGWGVAGSAISTVLSEASSCLFVRCISGSGFRFCAWESGGLCLIKD